MARCSTNCATFKEGRHDEHTEGGGREGREGRIGGRVG